MASINTSTPTDNRPESNGKPSANPLDQYSVQPKSEQKDDSPFYHSSAPTIELPKGGGALKGIDEKFSINAINGTSSLQVALPFSPGRGGFTPGLSLSYNSGSGNSEFGLGWNLSLPSIQRKTDKKLPKYDDLHESDVFLLAGAEDLVPQLDGSGNPVSSIVDGVFIVKRYIPRIEGLYARIEFIKKSTNNESWWRVTTKDNITTYYGLTANSRLSDPDRKDRVFKWLPEVVCDHKGNAQQYYYKDEDLINVRGGHEKNRLSGLSLLANKYLKRVGYCNATPWFNQTSNIYTPVLPDTATAWLMQVVLDYGDHSNALVPHPDQSWPYRSDAFSDFHAGFEIRTYRLCRKVLMFHTFTELNGGIPTLVRSLDLTYQNDGAGSSELFETDFITTIIQSGYEKSGSTYLKKSLPALTLSHQPLVWNTNLQSVSPKDAENMPQGLTGNYQWTDLWGEGLPGILTEQGTGWFYKTNLGEGHFSPAVKVSPKPNLRGLGSAAQWQDLDADGRRQLVSRDRSMPGYFELNDDQQWQTFRSFPENVNVDWNSPYTKMLDLDGDGRADLLLAEDRVWTWYQNKGTEGITKGGQNRVFQDEEKGPRLLLNDRIQRIFLADMNGDGMTDLVRITNGEVSYWPNKGYGNFGAKVSMTNAPRFDNPEDFNPLYLTLSDISGTGAPDLIYLGNNKCTAWINLAGNAWGPAKELGPLPGMDPDSKIGVMDFLGNGTGCIVWSSPLPRHANAPIRYMDLMGGVKPYLMLSYANGMGKQIGVTYTSSTKYYLADKLSGTPWATRLPFPVQCVSEISTTDSVSETTYKQSYSYHHGYYDHEEREFRGFGRVDAIDTDTAKAPTGLPGGSNITLDQAAVLTKTWYHTGAWLREKTLLDQFKKEYFLFEGWDDLITIANFPVTLNPQETREAHRALKGSALRQEVYALDGSDKQGVPYTVSASAYCVKLVQKKFKNRFASFFNYQQQSIAFSCERNAADPRIAHSLTLEIDPFGNVLKQAQVVYPRLHVPSSLPTVVQAEQGKMHINYSENIFTKDIDTDTNHYRLRMPKSSKGFELAGCAPSALFWNVDELLNAAVYATEIDFLDTASTGIEKRLLTSSRIEYLGNDTSTVLIPPHAGDLESLGLVYQQYHLAFSEKFLDTSTGNPYNNYVGATKLAAGKYVDLDGDSNFWVPSGLTGYTSPASSFYLPTSFTDPFTNTTTLSYWGTYCLLPLAVTDPVGNVMEVLEYDWRILQPISIKDPNDNISNICFDKIGMPVAMAVAGKGTEADYLELLTSSAPIVADVSDDLLAQEDFWAATSTSDLETAAAALLGKATWRCIYDLTTAPLRVAMIARERHYEDLASSPLLIRISYTDGFGRVAMHKAQAVELPGVGGGAATPQWIGSGKTVYNNKGKPVLQYEPYFSPTFAYDQALQAASSGVSPRIYYDPVGRVHRTELPDGTFSYTEWDNWSQTVFDPIDSLGIWVGTPGSGTFISNSDWYNARIGGALGSEEQDAASKSAIHANTPTIMHSDSLGRPFYSIQHNRYLNSSSVWTDQIISSYEVLDIQGNRLSVIDGRGLTPLTYVYNLLKGPCFQHSNDGGNTYSLLDVAGQSLYHWDAVGTMFHSVYDAIHRQIEQWGDSNMLGRINYGEGLTDDRLKNLRGQAVSTYDGAGKHYVDEFNFQGLPVVSYMQLLKDATIIDANWNALSDGDLVPDELFFSEVVIDALGRPMSADSGRIIGSGSPVTEHNVTYTTYQKDGALKTTDVGGDNYVQDIHHNAKGQREAIWYGNNTKTTYTYDPRSLRLSRLVTINLTTTDNLQDLKYYYDAVGNITQVIDNAQEDVFFSGSRILPANEYTYDALYRLIVAKGRESIANPNFTNDNSSDSHAFVNSLLKWDGSSSALQQYKQKYSYDEVGNILELQHIGLGSGPSFTRLYDIDTASNRLNWTKVGSTYTYTHDARGNMVQMPHLHALDYNMSNQMCHITSATTETYYQYSGGQRVRKYLDKGHGNTEERIYFGNYEVYRKYSGSSTPDIERTTIHVFDEMGRVAMIELLNPAYGSDGSASSLKRFVYSNHLQSAILELNGSGDIISYEEYHPFGTTAYQAMNSVINAIAKRYRFTGKERDEETGLNYHGARYYVPWLSRWVSVDPLESKYVEVSTYNYSLNNPIVYIDSTGMSAEDTNTPHIGKTQVIQVQDENGNPINFPNNTPLEYKPWGEGPEWDPFKGQSSIVTGAHVLSQPTDGAAMVTETITYRYGYGESKGKLFVAGYKQTSELPSNQHFEQNGKSIEALDALHLHLLPVPMATTHIDKIPLHKNLQFRPLIPVAGQIEKPGDHIINPKKLKGPVDINVDLGLGDNTFTDRLGDQAITGIKNIINTYAQYKINQMVIDIFISAAWGKDKDNTDYHGTWLLNPATGRVADPHNLRNPVTKPVNTTYTHIQNVTFQFNEMQKMFENAFKTKVTMNVRQLTGTGLGIGMIINIR